MRSRPVPRPRPRCFALTALLLATACGLAASDRAYPSADEVRPLLPGSRVPAVQVLTVAGVPVDLAAHVSETGALLVFYRGGW